MHTTTPVPALREFHFSFFLVFPSYLVGQRATAVSHTISVFACNGSPGVVLILMSLRNTHFFGACVHRPAFQDRVLLIHDRLPKELGRLSEITERPLRSKLGPACGGSHTASVPRFKRPPTGKLRIAWSIDRLTHAHTKTHESSNPWYVPAPVRTDRTGVCVDVTEKPFRRQACRPTLPLTAVPSVPTTGVFSRPRPCSLGDGHPTAE